MKKACLILDVAHGNDTPGKRSVDGVFREYSWSRDRVKDIYTALIDFDLPFEEYAPFMSWRNEPGLRKRVDVYNERSSAFDNSIMLSLHVDAFKDPPQWWDGTGFSFFTNRLHNTADELAEVMAQIWGNEMPGERIRRNRSTDVSKDANFTVIWGYKDVRTKYHGILIENLFMDNKRDVYDKLMDDNWNLLLVNTYLIAIFEMFESLGYMTNI